MEGLLDYMMRTRVEEIRERRDEGMIFAWLAQQNHSSSGLRAVSRGALAAGDLERPQQKRSPKRVSGGDDVVEGGPSAGLLGYMMAIRHFRWSRTTHRVHLLFDSHTGPSR